MSDFPLDSDLESPGRTPIASDGSSFLVVSCRETNVRPFNANLVGQIIDVDRQNIGAEIQIAASIATGNTGCRFTRPEITFDGSNYLVTYMGPLAGIRHILAKRISPAGLLLDSNPIDVSGNVNSSSFEPAVVYTGAAHLVIWHESSVGNRILGSMVSPDGTVSATFNVFDDLNELYPQQMSASLWKPQIARASDRVLVAVEPRFAFDVRQPERPVYAQILDLNGTTQLAAPLLVREDNGDNPRYVQVASDGQSFLITWVEGLLQTNTISSGLFGVFGRQISTGVQIINGDASTTGLEIQPVSDFPIEELNVSYIDGRYSVLWSSTSFRTDFGIYENTVSTDLATITIAAPVAGTRDATLNLSMPRASSPDVAATIDQTLYVWPSRDGTIDACQYRFKP